MLLFGIPTWKNLYWRNYKAEMHVSDFILLKKEKQPLVSGIMFIRHVARTEQNPWL